MLEWEDHHLWESREVERSPVEETGGLVGMVIVDVRVDNNTINAGYYIIIMIRMF